MQKVSNIIGKLEIAVSLFSLTIHSLVASFLVFRPEPHDPGTVADRDFAGALILVFIFFLFPSLVLLLGSYLHAKKYKEGGVIIFFIAIPMLPIYLYLSFFAMWGMTSLLSLQFLSIVVFLLIPLTMFVLAVMQAAKINSSGSRSDLP